MKFNETDLTQLHEDLQTKKISAKELTKAAFDRIKETDDDVNHTTAHLQPSWYLL